MKSMISSTKIRRARERRGLTQSELAARLGCHSTQVSHIESGRRGMSAERLANLARILGVPMEELFAGRRGRAAAP